MVKLFKLRNIITLILLIISFVTILNLVKMKTQHNKLIQTNRKLQIQNTNLLPYKLQIDSIRVIEQNIKKLKPTFKNSRRLSQAVYLYSDQYKIDPNILISIARIESNFEQHIISHTNCVEYFQLNANVHKLNQEYKYDQFYQTDKACQIFSYFRKIAKYDTSKSLNLYNGSQYNNYSKLVMKYYCMLT